jgi:prephenate dehydrogenase|tara:strand:- start:129 stop:1001 length:873 start_codon:yes stop_codon:yes gene_type:complete
VKIAIIGGSGKMGRWFANFLVKEGREVIITGRNQRKLLEAKQQLGNVEVATNVEAVKRADVIVVSTPIDGFEEVIKQICLYTRPEQIIIDITSIKKLPVEVMHKHIKKGVILGTHPMFGPGARDIANQNFVLTPTNKNEKALAQKVREYLETRDARVTLITPHQHDEMMSVILGLSHFIAIVSADTLVSLDKLKLMRAISGSTYKLWLTLVESVIAEDPESCASLQMNLPDGGKVKKLFQGKLETWADLVENKDRQKFVQRMKNLRNKLEKDDPDLPKAYENMYKLIAEL